MFVGGNIFGLIVGKITDIVLQWSEHLVNWAIEKVESAVCGWFGCNFGRVCLTVGENVYRCEHAWGGDSLEWMLGCGYRADTREARQCFFARQRAICMEGDPSRYKRYQKLFEAPKKAELEQDFFSIVGKYAPAPHRTKHQGTPPISPTPRPRSTFDAVPPTLNAAFDRLQLESSNDVWTQSAKNLCDSALWDTMDIDEIIVRPSCRVHRALAALTP